MAEEANNVTPTISEQEWRKCIQEVSANLQADMCIITGALQSRLDDDVIRCVEANRRKKNILLILTTFGGDAAVAYRIARCFQGMYRDGVFTVFVPDVCKSAGTLLTIGAHQLIMDDCAQLGPLDVQVSKPDELGEWISGLTPVHSLRFLQEHAFKLFEHNFLELIARSGAQITTRTAAEIATKLTTGLFQPVYSQLDPLRLGEYHRNMMVAAEYGRRLDKGNLKSANVLKKLTHGYPSHGFVIDREEAETLFAEIRQPTDAESRLARWLKPIVTEDLLSRDGRGTVKYLHVVDAESDEGKTREGSGVETEKPEEPDHEHEKVDSIRNTEVQGGAE